MKVEHRGVDAAGMVTIGQEHPAWANPLEMGDVEGQFVRLDPPLNSTDEEVVRMRAQAEDLGAVAVKVLPVRRDAVLSANAVSVEDAPHLAARDVVRAMLAESRSRDPDRLRALVEDTMAMEGL